MDKTQLRQEIINTLEESIAIQLDTLGHYNRLSIYNTEKKFLIEQTKKDIDFDLQFIEKIKNKPL